MNDEILREKWTQLVQQLSERFADGEELDVDGILFLVGVQELQMGYRKFKKDEKVNLLHIAICRVLEPLGYYRYDGRDAEGWPHYEVLKPLPALKPGEQAVLMKTCIIQYFEDEGIEITSA
jgi:hypothetical protein